MTIKWQKNIGLFTVYKTKTVEEKEREKNDRKQAHNENKNDRRIIINQIGQPYAVLHQCPYAMNSPWLSVL